MADLTLPPGDGPESAEEMAGQNTDAACEGCAAPGAHGPGCERCTPPPAIEALRRVLVAGIRHAVRRAVPVSDAGRVADAVVATLGACDADGAEPVLGRTVRVLTALVRERDALREAVQQLGAERDALREERDALRAEREDWRAAHARACDARDDAERRATATTWRSEVRSEALRRMSPFHAMCSDEELAERYGIARPDAAMRAAGGAE